MTKTAASDFTPTKKGWETLLPTIVRLASHHPRGYVEHTSLLRHVAKLWKAAEMKEVVEELKKRGLVETQELGVWGRRVYRLTPGFQKALEAFKETAAENAIAATDFPKGWETAEAIAYSHTLGLTNEWGELK